MASEPRLRTERLLLRRWRPQDREPFAAMNAYAEVMEHFRRLRRCDRASATIAAPRG